MKRRILTLLVVITILACFVSTATASAATTKNETIYASLKHDGGVQKIYIVNQLLGDYIDYGKYTDIKNLSTLSKPSINGDKIMFPDADVEGGLYYQGTMQGELPMIFDIKYYLDGRTIPAQSLGGASGRMMVKISYRQNKKCLEKVRDGLMAQIGLTLSMDNASNIVADGAASVVVGNSVKINFTALPGEDGTAILKADVDEFEMEAISITLIKGNMSFDNLEESIDEFQDGFDDMLDGANEMLDGTSELKDGISSLLDGVGDLSYGMSKLKKSGQDIGDGMQEYGTGLNEYLDGIKQMSDGSARIQAGFNELSQSGSSVAAGVSQVSSGLNNLSASGQDLKSLAQSLLSNPDPQVQALAQGMLQTLGGIDQLSGGLNDASSGVAQYVAGVQQTAEQYNTFNSGIKTAASSVSALNDGYSEMSNGYWKYYDGIKSSASGAYRMYKSIKGLPDDIQLLIDGQIDFKDGIAGAKDDIEKETEILRTDDTPAVSFASPNKNHPNSVQYILTTPAIELPKQDVAASTEENSENFFTRLAKLFQ